tara:strand:- start:730 stop:1581 length:852 start_codon:yes stop_codon:yes gene_type:complete
VSKFFPLIFVLLWSSAFITTLPIVLNSDPFSALAFRFFFVALCFFVFCIYKRLLLKISINNLVNSLSTGILFHGFYLGGVFYAIFMGLPTGIVALIVTLQPILTNIFAGYMLNENVSINQWIGVVMGFVGTVLVIGFDVGKSLPLEGIISTVIALLAITISTIWQKKVSNNIPLAVNNMYQAIGAVLFHLIIIVFIFKKPFLKINIQFLLAMSHQIFLVSLGAFSILMFLIKKNSASKTISLFFLIPIVTASMAWLFLNEDLTVIDLIGFIIASIGVFIATSR